MPWEENVFALFEDLEMQADGLYLEQRRDEVESLVEAGYAEVTLASRLQASLGAEVRFRLAGGADVRGCLVRVGDGWVLLDARPGAWLLQLHAVTAVAGLVPTSMSGTLLPATARLSIRSALRGFASVGEPCVLWQTAGQRASGVLGRVGADFVELASAQDDLVLPTASLAAVHGLR